HRPGKLRTLQQRRHHVRLVDHAGHRRRLPRRPQVTDPLTNDPLTYDTSPDVCWTRTNVAEVSPGVLTPLAWSFLGKLVDVSSRRGFCQLGAIPASALRYPDDVDQHIMGAFHGRIALNVSVLRAMMSGFPGVSGDDVERDIVGSVRPGVVDASYGWRGPA